MTGKEFDTGNPALDRRFRLTLDFMAASLPPTRLLDLGASNSLSDVMQRHGYDVQNTSGDLDEVPEAVRGVEVEAATAFEILEHLVGPLNELRVITAPRLFASVPRCAPA